MIHATVNLQNDDTICQIWLRSAPNAGEFLWLRTEERDRINGQYRTLSFKVIEVAHWVGSWSPATHTGDPLHSICVYVEPVLDCASSSAEDTPYESIATVPDELKQSGTQILAWWPLVELNDEGDLTDTVTRGSIKGAWVPTRWLGDYWDAPDWFEAVGPYFGDDCSYALNPTHWTHLPPAPVVSSVSDAGGAA